MPPAVPVTCPYCGSKRIVINGRANDNGQVRWRCDSCGIDWLGERAWRRA